MPHLELVKPDQTVRFEFTSSKIRVGRHADNEIRIQDDRLVSRHHCEVARTASGYVLRDLQSSNGTQMKGLSVVKVVLQPGDEFTVGNTLIRFVDTNGSQGGTLTDRFSQLREPEPEPTPAGSAPGPVQPAAPPPAPEPPRSAPAQPDADHDHDLAIETDDPAPVVSKPDFGVISIEGLATIGNDPGFDLSALSLLNARSQMVHAASAGDDVRQSRTAETLRVLQLLVLGCIRSGASDIHLEPKQVGGLIRLRIDGAMVEISHVDPDTAKRVMSLIKVLCDIDISKKSIIQEGHFSVQTPARRIDYRVSFTPAMFGQKLVIRVLDPENSPQKLRDLQLPDWMYTTIRDTARRDTGMVLICGPTGSGKTTTLYAVLRQIDARLRNVLTIEDPVEYEVEGVTQIPVDEERGHSFHSLLRSCLRQDPDVIVLGEIRDRDTAITAMQAATTGHLVLSTVHAKDTIGTIFRLLDLGAEPYLVASTLNLVLAQRLVRLLCPHCKIARKPKTNELMRLRKSVEGIGEVHQAVGCPRCFGTGYAGRSAVFELLTATDELRDIILKNPNLTEIKKAVEMTVFRSLRDTGVEMIVRGQTSFEEVNRVIGID